jgi:hypothetical protein
MRRVMQKPYSNFSEIQESHCLQENEFLKSKPQNANNLPKLTQESHANVFHEPTEFSEKTLMTPSSSSNSSLNIFKEAFRQELSDSESEPEEVKEKYKIGNLYNLL